MVARFADIFERRRFIEDGADAGSVQLFGGISLSRDEAVFVVSAGFWGRGRGSHHR